MTRPSPHSQRPPRHPHFSPPSLGITQRLREFHVRLRRLSETPSARGNGGVRLSTHEDCQKGGCKRCATGSNGGDSDLVTIFSTAVAGRRSPRASSPAPTSLTPRTICVCPWYVSLDPCDSWALGALEEGKRNWGGLPTVCLRDCWWCLG